MYLFSNCHVFTLASYKDACEYRDIREESSAIYNTRRMYEAPHANIGTGDAASMSATNARIEESSRENLLPNDDADEGGQIADSASTSPFNARIEENSRENSPPNSDANDQNADPTTPPPIEEVIVESNYLVTVKFEGEPHQLELFEPEEDEIDAIFEDNDPSDSSSDENEDAIIFIDNGEPLPKPINYTMEMMIKRTNDPISGNLAFSEMVSTVQLQRFRSIL